MRTGYNKQILKAISLGLCANILLAVLKLTSGFIGHSQALVSDGLNSFSDVFISLMLLVVLRIATKKPDHDHPYGHEKYEGIAYFLLGIIFIITAIYIGNISISSIIDFIKNPTGAIKPSFLTLIVSIIALIIKIILFRYYKVVSNKYESLTLKADSRNHLLDAWATLFTVLGIFLSQFNLVIFDYIASLVIGLFILRLAIQILIESIAYLVDQAPSDETVKKISLVIQSVKGVMMVDDLKVRKHMTQKYVDVEIGVQSSLTLEAAHKIAENVHHKVEGTFSDVIHCMVHVNPHK